MKTSKLFATLLVLTATATATYAGPGAQYWQQRRNPPASAQTTVAAKDQAAPKPAAAPAECEGAKNCKQCATKS